jgi:hypothetical protein
MKTTTLQLKHSMNRLSRQLALLLITLALACFALAPQARAVCQDTCLTNDNTVQGDSALISLTTGTDNTAVGFSALSSNTIGSHNTAIGSQALLSNTITGDNTAVGYKALYSNTTGADNTATGELALNSNTTGPGNTATGSSALVLNTTGYDNTAVGVNALFSNTTGNSNIALGDNAGLNLTTGSNNIDIGNPGVAGETRRIRIGTIGTQTKTFIAGISGATVPNGVGVIVGSNGQLGTVVSSERFKDSIQPMDKASEAILALKPVTFRYKRQLDPNGIPQFGLVAEQVEKVNPDLVARDEQGTPYTVRYEAVNAMLLNEFLKEHREVQEQKATIVELRSALGQQQKDFQATVAELRSAIKAQAAQLQQVNAQIEMSKPTLQTIANNQ